MGTADFHVGRVNSIYDGSRCVGYADANGNPLVKVGGSTNGDVFKRADRFEPTGGSSYQCFGPVLGAQMRAQDEAHAANRELALKYADYCKHISPAPEGAFGGFVPRTAAVAIASFDPNHPITELGKGALEIWVDDKARVWAKIGYHKAPVDPSTGYFRIAYDQRATEGFIRNDGTVVVDQKFDNPVTLQFRAQPHVPKTQKIYPNVGSYYKPHGVTQDAWNKRCFAGITLSKADVHNLNERLSFMVGTSDPKFYPRWELITAGSGGLLNMGYHGGVPSAVSSTNQNLVGRANAVLAEAANVYFGNAQMLAGAGAAAEGFKLSELAAQIRFDLDSKGALVLKAPRLGGDATNPQVTHVTWMV